MEIMNRALKMKDSLKLSGMMCVFDQSIFAKAGEIKWRDPSKCKSCILLLGRCHTIMMYMNVISKRFKDAPLQDVLKPSGAITQGSIDSALMGKMCNRGVGVTSLCMKHFIIYLFSKWKAMIKMLFGTTRL